MPPEAAVNENVDVVAAMGALDADTSIFDVLRAKANDFATS